MTELRREEPGLPRHGELTEDDRRRLEMAEAWAGRFIRDHPVLFEMLR